MGRVEWRDDNNSRRTKNIVPILSLEGLNESVIAFKGKDEKIWTEREANDNKTGRSLKVSSRGGRTYYYQRDG